MAIVFWDSEGVVHLDWFKATRSRPGLTGELYAAILDRLHESLEERRPERLRRGILFLQDNAPCHKTEAVLQKLEEFKFKIVPHPPYSPDLAPSDYYLFRGLKNHMRGKICESEETLKQEVREYFESKSKEFYFKGIDCLKDKLKSVIESEGAYIPE